MNNLKALFGGLLSAFLTANTALCFSQTQGKFGIYADAGFVFVTGKNQKDQPTEPNYGIGAALSFSQYFNTKVAFETGIRITQMNFRRRNEFNPIDSFTVFTSVSAQQYNIISIPLKLDVKIGSVLHKPLWIGAGFRYGFVIKSTMDITQCSYVNKKIIKETFSANNPRKVGLTQSESKPIDDFLFNVAGTLQGTLHLSSRVQLRLFYDYSFYDLNATNRKGVKEHLNYAGLGLGFVF